MSEQVSGNVDKTPTDELVTKKDVSDAAEFGIELEAENDTDDFFGELDKALEPELFDSAEKEATSTKSAEPSFSVNENNLEALKQKLEQTEKRYGDSSKEAKRLVSRIKELEPYEPLLNEMRNNPALIQHVKNFYEKGGQTPQNLKEELQLSEDFLFDMDEAMSNPQSESAKVLDSIVNKRVESTMNKKLQEQNKVIEQKSREEKLRQKFKSDSEYDKFKEWTMNNSLNEEMLVWLYQKANGLVEKSTEDAIKKDMLNQMQNVHKKPASVAGRESLPSVVKTPEAKFIDSLMSDTSNDKNMQSFLEL